jgi:hypothetical protein
MWIFGNKLTVVLTEMDHGTRNLLLKHRDSTRRWLRWHWQPTPAPGPKITAL